MFFSDTKQKRTLNISLILKMPIDLEIEVLGVPPTNNYQAEDKKENQNLFNFIGEPESEVIVNGASLADLDECSQALVSQVVGQFKQTSQIFSTLSQTQYQEDLVNDEIERFFTI
ncbi:hypothetical protein HW132_26610 [Brasilonema sp. CT11]|nr:hypothetical protein [Brasilonema sp. CT11]